MSDYILYACLLVIGFGLGWHGRGETDEAAHWRRNAEMWRRVAERWKRTPPKDGG
jgi:hypothetical protein